MNTPCRLLLRPRRRIPSILRQNLSTSQSTKSEAAAGLDDTKKINPTVRRAFQESIKFLKDDSESLKSKLTLIKSSSSPQDGLSPEEELRLEILSEINDFKIRRNHHLGHEVDMSKPIYRFLEQQRWRKGGRLGRLMQTIHRLRIFPDLFHSFDPQVDLKIKFPLYHRPEDPITSTTNKLINIGNFVPSSKSTNPPTIQIQVFHEEPRLYTILMVDPDVPDPKNHTFTNFLHWFVPNVPISATKNGDLELKENEAIEYIGPHPAEGSGQHRYTILIFEQPNGCTIDPKDHPGSLERVGFCVRKMAECFSLKPVGVSAWVSQWDGRDASWISSIYKDQLKIHEPRYGPEPKPFNPRVKLPPHSNLPLTHRHPAVIPWRQRSSSTSSSPSD